MRALTVHQPWAALIAARVKTIETRSWPASYRGPLAIHAAKRRPEEHLQVGTWTVGHTPDGHWSAVDNDSGQTIELAFGVVVATCTLVDIVPVDYSADIRRDGGAWPPARPVCICDHQLGTLVYLDSQPYPYPQEASYGVFTGGRYAWLLDNIQPVATPVAAKGHPQLWEWDNLAIGQATYSQYLARHVTAPMVPDSIYTAGYIAGGRSDGIRHAATSHRSHGPRSPFVAACGVFLSRWSDEPFNPDHPNVCPRCVDKIRQADTDGENRQVGQSQER